MNRIQRAPPKGWHRRVTHRKFNPPFQAPRRIETQQARVGENGTPVKTVAINRRPVRPAVLDIHPREHSPTLHYARDRIVVIGSDRTLLGIRMVHRPAVGTPRQAV